MRGRENIPNYKYDRLGVYSTRPTYIHRERELAGPADRALWRDTVKRGEQRVPEKDRDTTHGGSRKMPEALARSHPAKDGKVARFAERDGIEGKSSETLASANRRAPKHVHFR